MVKRSQTTTKGEDIHHILVIIYNKFNPEAYMYAPWNSLNQLLMYTKLKLLVCFIFNFLRYHKIKLNINLHIILYHENGFVIWFVCKTVMEIMLPISMLNLFILICTLFNCKFNVFILLGKICNVCIYEFVRRDFFLHK